MLIAHAEVKYCPLMLGLVENYASIKFGGASVDTFLPL